MKNKPTRYSLSILVLCLAITTLAQGQTSSMDATNLDQFLNLRIKENISARVDQTDPTKQSAPPAATGNSTSLVERSSAPDLLGLGLDFLNLSEKAGGDKKSATPKTLTFSAYALKSFLGSQDALDPQIYKRDQKWRRVSFTVGYDVPENTDDRDPVVGIKWLVINGRDISSAANDADITNVQNRLKDAGMDFSALRGEVRTEIFRVLQKRNALPSGVSTLGQFNGAIADPAEFPKILKALTGDEKNIIDQKILSKLNAFRKLDETTKNAVRNIRSRPQFALAFSTTQRKGGRPDDYNGTLTFDKGMGTNSITMNGSFIFTNNPLGEDTRGGKFAAGFHLPLSGFKPLDYKDPMLLSIEGDATAMTKTAPIYKAQAKLTIPLLPGMEIPISVSVANRTEFVKEKEVKGKFGFTFDVSKALKAFRDSFLKIE